MSRQRTRVVAVFSLLLVAGGVALLFDSGRDQAAADRRLLHAVLASMTQVRELDRIVALAERDAAGRAEALDAAREWQLRAPGHEEPQHAAAVRACLEPPGCDAGLAAAAQQAKAFLSATVGASWKAADLRAARAEWHGWGGVAACTVGVLLAVIVLLTAYRSTRPTADVRALLDKRSEQLYQAQLKAWETERFAAYGEIVAGLSHGLKTPLAGIRAAAQLAQAKLDPESPARVQLKDIIGRTDGLVEQVRRLMQATDSRSPVPVRVRPSTILATIDKEYAGTAADRGLRLRVAPSKVGEILVDPGSLIMALRNLVENALAVSPDGGRVTVSSRSCAAPERAGQANQPPPQSDWLEIVVEDEGPGVPEEVAAGHDVESSKPDGSGLGLAIARRIVMRYGGALLCDRAAGGGARVAAKLPVAAAEPRGTRS